MNLNVQSPERIKAKLFTDPSCPWSYAVSPSMRTIEWRYRDQIEWQLVMIGQFEPGGNMPKRSPVQAAQFWVDLRGRSGMPFAAEPKSRVSTSARACHAVVAAGLLQPGFEWRVMRTLQLLQFNTPLLLDDDSDLRAALSSVADLDAEAVMAALDLPPVENEYQRGRAESRSASGGAAELQGKTAASAEGVRYGGPSVVFSRGDLTLEAGGVQPVEVYDTIIANLAPELTRNDPPGDPLEALRLYPGGLSTQEVAAVMAQGNEPADRGGTEKELVGLLVDGRVRRVAMGNDAIWLAA